MCPLQQLLELRRQTLIALTSFPPGGFQHLGVVLMQLLGYGAMFHLKPKMCWPRQTDEQDVPVHPQAPGFLRGPRPICFYGWETPQSTQTPPHVCTPIACNPPAIALCLTKNVNTLRKQDLLMQDIHFIVQSDTNCTHCLQIQKEITYIFQTEDQKLEL